jgi:hypothetical protein
MNINQDNSKPIVLAYYLPQFYPTDFNNKWYGKGFTEWTNVGKARPLFKGHYQPKVPSELGYYDMRLPEIAEQQAELAQEAGITGFAYWHYWFGNGKTMLDMPMKRAIDSGKPDFPFCLAWANESWYKKMWDDNGSKALICEQTYPGDDDIIAHFRHCLPAFKDCRYIRYNDCPVFIVYKPEQHPDIKHFMEKWNELIKAEGIADKFYFIATIYKTNQASEQLNNGFDAVTYEAWSKLVSKLFYEDQNIITRFKRVFTNRILNTIFQKVKKLPYKKVLNVIWREGFDSREDVIPILIPNFDHSPRSGRKNYIITDATPDNWEKQIKIVLDEVSKKKNKLIILRAWNEWGEGNYMEPDLKYGRSFIEKLGSHING